MGAYVVMMEGREYSVAINTDGMITVEGCEEEINVQPLGGDAYSVLLGNHLTPITARRIGDGYHVLLKNNQVEVNVETERDRLVKKYATSSVATHQRHEIRAPMPALVVRVEVKVSDEVKVGQGLVILEAMKMENEIKSHQSGRVKEIYVAKGKPVEKGELLLLLE
jgi:pyruvate carboxylase subunit B